MNEMVDRRLTMRGAEWGRLVALAGVAAIGIVFVLAAAIPYLTLDQQRFGVYWPRRGWLLLHIAGGMVALLSGPVQLWLGLSPRHLAFHRVLGLTYIASVAVSSVAALYLAFHTDYGWVFGMGLSGLAIAWISTTGMALLAIRRRIISQHQEWMIRSYVVTFAFVTFRAGESALGAAGVGTVLERIAAMSWFCWAVPLLITECILQGRKIVTGRPRLPIDTASERGF
jgi:uncharacterized membrane protein